MTADFHAEAMGTTGMNVAPGLQMLLSTLNGVCFLLAVSMQFDPRTLRAVRIINACLSLAMGATFYVLVFSVAAIRGANHAADPLFMSYLFDAMDVFIAIAATIRAMGAAETQERRFFYIISIFMWINTVFPAMHNHILIEHDFVWLDLFISAPYLLLVVLIVHIRSADLCFAKPSLRVARWVRSGSPIFLSFGLLLVGMLVFRTQLYVGATAILMAIICYGVLNVLTQSRGIEAEESLVAAKKHLESLVGVDSLTGIANRRTFDQMIAADCRAARRSALAISLLMIDVEQEQAPRLNAPVQRREVLPRLPDAGASAPAPAACPQLVQAPIQHGGLAARASARETQLQGGWARVREKPCWNPRWRLV